MKWAGTLIMACGWMMTDGDDCCQNLGPPNFCVKKIKTKESHISLGEKVESRASLYVPGTEFVTTLC
jgi:hypothetical protein